MTAQPNIIPLPSPDSPPDWTKTKFANLWRYEPNGTYHCKATVCGVAIHKSLKTTSLTIAKSKVDALLASERKRLKHKAGDVTFAQLAEQFEGEIAESDLKPRSKRYRIETLKQLKRTWPELYGKTPNEIKEAEVKEWAKRAKERFSPTRFNGTFETLRRLVGICLQRGLLIDDPTAKIERASVLITAPDLPDSEQVKRLIDALDGQGASKNKRIARSRKDRGQAVPMIKFIMFSGCRVEAARQMTGDNIDLANNVVILPKVKYDDRPVRVPMIGQLRQLCEQLVESHKWDVAMGQTDNRLFRLNDPAQTLETACRDAGIPRLTPHKLRHLWGTIALQQTKDVRWVAECLGHKDGGALLLKRYAHILNDYSQQQAKKVTFSPTIESGPANKSPS